MTGKTHIAVGMASAIPISFIVNPLVLFPLILAGSLIPDVDADYSIIKKGRSVKYLIICGLIFVFLKQTEAAALGFLLFLSFYIFFYLISRFSERKSYDHRTVCHSLLGAVIFTIPVGMITIKGAIIFFMGYMLHLFCDSLTVAGVPLLYPRKQTFGLRKYKTGESIELKIKAACYVLIVLRILYLFN